MNHLWHRHPGVRSGSQLTVGERAADALRNGMGTNSRTEAKVDRNTTMTQEIHAKVVGS